MHELKLFLDEDNQPFGYYSPTDQKVGMQSITSAHLPEVRLLPGGLKASFTLVTWDFPVPESKSC